MAKRSSVPILLAPKLEQIQLLTPNCIECGKKACTWCGCVIAKTHNLDVKLPDIPSSTSTVIVINAGFCSDKCQKKRKGNFTAWKRADGIIYQ